MCVCMCVWLGGGGSRGLKPKILRLPCDRETSSVLLRLQQGAFQCAAREFSVPESFLRDRTRGNVTLDSRVGVKYMASIGHGYKKADIQYMARNYALSLNKPVKSSDHLSNVRFCDFLKRWPDSNIVKT